MAIPEPTPQEKALKRVTTLSRLNGWSVVVVAALGGLLALVLGDWFSVGLGAMIGALGWLEVHGHRLLRRRDPEGLKWIIRSQLLLLALILAYCASRLGSFDGETVLASLTPEMEAVLKDNGINRADILPLVRLAFIAIYGGVALTTVIYQGGLALYYRSKVRLVTEALVAPPPGPGATPLA